MNILRLTRAELAFGEQAILHDANFNLDRGERVALIGRNGTGKSTLLKIINGEVALDDGEIRIAPSLNIAYLQQEVPAAAAQTLFEVVAAGLKEEIHTDDAWQTDYKVERILDMLKLPGEQTMGDSSGGIRRRAMLGQALVSDPDLLLLDEPTNHLDIASIESLQEYILAADTTMILISHDRTMIDDVATRIIELERGTITSYPGNYAAYLVSKAKADAEEADANRKFDQHLANEEVWIRQGIKARRTRNEGRVRRLEALRLARKARTEKQGNANLKIDSGEKSGQLVAVLDNVTFGYETTLFDHFSTRISRGDRVAIIGPNGSGKSTLLQLLLGDLEPHSGKIERGTKLKVAYFDQQRSALNPNETVRNNVSPGSDHVTVGKSTKHIVGYLADFLFPSSYLNMPVAKLSGGEKNRLLMAKLFAQPANVLVLDEPTNDLDMETLELFEELLADYTGTVLLVSHDRKFIDSVATSVIAFEDGQVTEYVGGYTDWQRQRKRQSKDALAKPAITTSSGTAKANKRQTKLSYKDQRELDTLPETIESLEAQQQQLQEQVMAADFYQQDDNLVKAVLAQLADAEQAVETAYQRWESLSAQLETGL